MPSPEIPGGGIEGAFDNNIVSMISCLEIICLNYCFLLNKVEAVPH